MAPCRGAWGGFLGTVRTIRVSLLNDEAGPEARFAEGTTDALRAPVG